MEDSPDRLACDLLHCDDLNGALRLAQGVIAQVGDQGNTPELWRCRFIVAEVMRLRGRAEEALKYLGLQGSVNTPPSTDLGSWAALTMHRGYCCGVMGRFELSHRLLQQAEVISRDAELLGLRAEVLLRLAMVFFLQRDYTTSDRIYRTLLGIGKELGSWYFRGTGLWGIGKNLMIQGHYRDARPWLEESLTIFEKAGAPLSVATVWSELGVCHLGVGEDAKALELFERSAHVDNESGAVHNYQVALANIGNVYLHRGHYLTAVSYYEQAVALARQIKDPISIQKWTYNIRLAYARILQTVDQQHPRPA